MIIWYNNSILASIISVLGSAGVVFAISDLVKGGGELSTAEAIGVIVVGVVMVILGKIISMNKEKKKLAQAQESRRAAVAASPAANATFAQPQYAPQAASYTPAAAPAATTVADEKPIKRAAVTAGIFFLLAVLMDLWATNLYGQANFDLRMSFLRVLPLVMYVLLGIAGFRTASTREACALHVVGFLGLAVNNGIIALNSYRANGFDSYITDQGIYHAMTLAAILEAAAFFVLLLFAIFAMKKARQNMGGTVRVLWIVPILVLAFVFAKDISDSRVLELLDMMLARGRFQLRPQILEALSGLFILLGSFCTALAFRRICKQPAQTAQQTAAPVYQQPQYTAPVQQAPVQPQYEAPRYEAPQAAPVQPQPAVENRTAPQASSQDVEKKIQACRDLLDCGILTQEEYEQEVRKIMRG